MADNTTKETVIFEIDVTSYTRSLAELSNSINALKADQKQYHEDAKKGIAGAAEAYEKVTVQLKNQQQAYRTTQAALTGYTASQKAGADVNNFFNNSIQTNRDLLKQLTAQYINTKKPSEELTKKVNELSKALKSQEGAIGDTRRNVGNYAEGFSSVIKSLGSSGGAFGSAIQGATGLNAAFSANPILGVVTALQQLFTLLSGNKEVIDAFEQATAFMGAAFSAVVDKVVQFGKAIYKTLSDPQKLLEDFGNLVKENILNRFKAVGLIVDAIADGSLSKLRDAFFQLGTGVSDIGGKISAAGKAFDSFGNDILKVATANREAAKGQQDLDDALRASNEAQAEQEVLIYKLIKASKDRTKSDEERIKLAKQALKLEEDRANKERQLADEQVKILEKQFKGLNLTDEQEDKLSQARVKRSNALRQTLVLQEKIQNDLNALEQQLADEKTARTAKQEAEEARINAAKQKAFDDEQKRLNTLADRNSFLEELRIKALTVGLEQEQKLYELQFEKRVEDFRAAGLTELQIEELKQKELFAIKEKYAEKSTNLTKDTVKTQAQIQDEQVKATTAIVGSGLETIGVIADILSAEIDAKQQELKDALEAGSISKEKYQEETTALKKKQFEQNKAIALSSAILQGINATLAAYTSGSAIPIVGAVTGPVFAALAAAFAAVQVGLIAAKPMPKFARGVIGLDGEGTETSDSVPAMLSKGESVVTAKATKKFHRQLAQMEMSVGNKPNYNFGNGMFANGIIGDAGFTTREIQANGQARIETQIAIKEAFKSMPNPVVSVKEISRVTKSVERSVRVSEA